MAQSGTFGQTLARHLGVAQAPSIVHRTVRKSLVAITELRIDEPPPEMTDPLPIENAFIVAVSLFDGYQRQCWLDERILPLDPPHRAGASTIMDLRRTNRARFLSPTHSIQLYFPIGTLKRIAQEQHRDFDGELEIEPSALAHDGVFTNLAIALAPIFGRPDEASHLFLESMTSAVANQLFTEYWHAPSDRVVFRGGLAPWQVRRATEMIEAHLDGSIGIAEIAAECGFSTRHFSRAFKQTVGVPPHRWLLLRRIERAKALMRGSSLSLAEVAEIACFANQSHFTRVFAAHVGQSPGSWRRVQN